MPDMPKYADVIVPLPLQEAFTYAVPPECQPKIQVGQRVIVPFGIRKFYTAIVLRLHDDTPPYPTKPISEVLDTEPIVLPKQLQLWKWVSDYYLCSMGDVFKAALPSGLKLESESTILPNQDWQAETPLKSSEEKVWQALQPKTKRSKATGQTLANLQKATGPKNILPWIM